MLSEQPDHWKPKAERTDETDYSQPALPILSSPAPAELQLTCSPFCLPTP